MQEVLSKTSDPKVPLRDQEFCTLRLFEQANQLGTRHCVGLSFGEWSDIDQTVMFGDEEVDYFWILDEAKKSYA